MNKTENELIILGLTKYPTIKGYCRAGRVKQQFEKLKQLFSFNFTGGN